MTGRPRSWQPALLHTCRQIRKEAFVTYLFKNRFVIKTRDCYGADGIAFSKIAAKHAGGAPFNVDIEVLEPSCATWDRLFAWLEPYHPLAIVVRELELDKDTVKAEGASEAYNGGENARLAMESGLAGIVWVQGEGAGH